MSGLCKDCRHWLTTADTYTVPTGWGECDKTWLQADAAGGGYAGAGMPKGTLAMATDWSAYKAVLQTHPDFGCVQFEAKS